MPSSASYRSRLLPFLLAAAVPLAVLAAWFAVQDPDSLVSPKSWANARSLIYDEFDLAAMALRGLNANCGRLAGRMTPPGEGKPVASWYEPFPADELPPEPRYF